LLYVNAKIDGLLPPTPKGRLMNKHRKQVLVRAMVYFAFANLVWESVQAPLYTILAQD
jgi:hypothetical protein